MNATTSTIVDRAIYDRAVARFRRRASCCRRSPSWPSRRRIPARHRERARRRRSRRADPLNLFRVHWYNDAARTGLAAVPEHVVLPEALTGVAAPIIVALGDRFPMIHAHKVLAAYACLARAWSPASSIRRASARCGRRPATTAAAASRSRASWAATASRSCPRG